MTNTQPTSLVARFSASFIKNYRITTLLFLSVLALGYFSYTRFLKVEGFPAVEVPVVFVQGTYFVNDATQVDRELTQPIERAASELSEVIEVTSTTTPVGMFVVAQFEEDIASEEGTRLFRENVEKTLTLPQGATLEYRTINAGAIDGEHELIFNVSGQQDIDDLQSIATQLAQAVDTESTVAVAEVIPLTEEQRNPFTGQTARVQTRFNRVGYRDGDTVVFERAVSIGVERKPGVGTVELSQAVKRAVDDFADSGALDDYHVTYGGDLSAGVLDQRISLEQNALFGLISVIILILLLIDWRASIVGGIFIPLVFAGVFIALYLIGYSLNIISLFSLVLVLGIFVDNATVLIDALERAKDEGHRGIEAVTHAVREVGTSVIAGTWTTVLVFIPMMFISGVLGKFIILIPVTVITALLISLFFTLTVIPWLGNLFIRDKHGPSQRPWVQQASRVLGAPSRVVSATSRWVARLVHDYLGRGWKIAGVIIVSLILIGLGGSYASRLNFSVFPPAKDTDGIVVKLEYPTGTTVSEAEQAATRLETTLRDTLENDLHAVTYYQADDKSALLMLDLTKVGERARTSNDMVSELQTATADFKDARITIEGETVGPPTDEFQLNVRVLASESAVLDRATKDVKTFLDGRSLSDGESVTDVVIDRFDVLTKIDGRRYAQVRAKISDPQKTNLVLGLQDQLSAEYDETRLEKLGLADDAIRVDLGQEGENVDSFTSAALALAIALIVMYGLLVWQFNSFTQPLLIFLAIPFSFPVLFPALFATGNSLSFFVMLGLIALAGVSVNNTIMLVHQANLLRLEGKNPREAISVAVGIRFRALMATSLTTIAGLVPLAMSDPFWEPLAYTIIFGLASSVVMAVLAFPAFYVIVEKIRGFKHRRVHTA